MVAKRVHANDGITRMRRIGSAAIHRRRGLGWTTLVLLAIAGIVLGVGACGGSTPPQQPPAIVDKGTPFGDLLVPKVQASVTDGAIGVRLSHR